MSVFELSFIFGLVSVFATVTTIIVPIFTSIIAMVSVRTIVAFVIIIHIIF